MFFNKKIVLTDKNNNVYRTVNVNANGNGLDISAKGNSEEFLEMFFAGEFISCGNLPIQKNVPNWQGEEVYFAILINQEVVATGSTLANHNFKLFAKENRTTKETKPISPPIDEPVALPEEESDGICESQKEERLDIDLPPQKSPLVEKEVHEFYCSIKQNLDEMLICYPKEEKLFSLIDDSEWVKVERQGENYVVGLIKNENAPEYVCYGVPATKELSPPDNLKKFCQWIPITDEDGYWMIFQDAKTGIAIENKNSYY